MVFEGKSLHSQSDKDLYLSKDLSILKYFVPDFTEGNQELIKKICSWNVMILKIVVVVLFIYIV